MHCAGVTAILRMPLPRVANPRRVFFELMRKHGLKACECVDSDFKVGELVVPAQGVKTDDAG